MRDDQKGGESCLGKLPIPEGGGGGEINNQDLTITSNGTYTASEGYTGIGTATVNVPNPSTGTINITSNGTYNVTQYASADVNCPSADIVSATNNTGSAIASGDKVWLEKSGTTWNIEKYDSDVEVFNKIGRLTITNKVVSGFSNSNFIELFSPFTGETAPWEIVVAFKITQTQSGNRDVFSSMSGVTGNYAGVTLGLNSNKFYLQLGLTSLTTSYEIITADFNASTNTKYWLKATWNGSVYGFSYSTDGQNYTSIGTVNSTAALYMAEKTRVGVYGNAVDHAFENGSIYLEDMYIKVNGKSWWTPYCVEPSILNSITGFANEAIANGASGEVRAVIGKK